MKKETIKRLVAFMCVFTLAFCDVCSVLAENVTDPPVTDTTTPEQGETETPAPEQGETETPAPEQGETETPAPEQGETETPAPEQPEHTHTYVETVTKEPTDTEKGEKTFTCECGDTYTEEIPALKLAVPAFSKVENKAEGIGLNWDAVDNAASYKIFKKAVTANEAEFAELTTVTADKTEYIDTAVESGSVYEYKIQAYNDTLVSEESSVVSMKYLAQPKVEVQIEDRDIVLTWDEVSGADSYNVEKMNADGTWGLLTTTKDKTYTEAGILLGTTYTYRVEAVSQEEGENAVIYKSAFSAEVSACETQIPVPASFGVANNGYTQLRLTWEAAEDVDGYYIYRADEEDGVYEKVATVEADVEKYIDKNLTTDQKYYYKMTAFAGEYESDFTAVKSGTPKVVVPKMKKTANATGTSIKVSWNKSTGAHGYYVYRKQGADGQWKKIATIKDPDTTSYNDKAAKGRYYYAVRAYKEVDGETFTSLRANSIQASVLKKVAITVSQKGSQRAVTVKWDKIANATGYQVYKKIGSNGSWVLAKTTGKDARSYSCEIPQGKNTYWKVRAIRKIGETTTYALYSTQKSFSFATPKFTFELSTNYGKSVKNIKLTIENTAKQNIRFLTDEAAIFSETNSKYDRALYIVGSSGNKLNYSTVNAGKTKTITYRVDGSSTRYSSDSILRIIFKYDGLEYVFLTYADGSYFELYLAEDFWNS